MLKSTLLLTVPTTLMFSVLYAGNAVHLDDDDCETASNSSTGTNRDFETASNRSRITNYIGSLYSVATDLNKSDTSRISAANALWKINNDAAKKSAVDALTTMATDPKTDINRRISAAKAIANINDDALKSACIEALYSIAINPNEFDTTRLFAAEALRTRLQRKE